MIISVAALHGENILFFFFNYSENRQFRWRNVCKIDSVGCCAHPECEVCVLCAQDGGSNTRKRVKNKKKKNILKLLWQKINHSHRARLQTCVRNVSTHVVCGCLRCCELAQTMDECVV